MQHLYDFRDDMTRDAFRVSLLDGDRLAVAIEIDGHGTRTIVLLDGRRRAREIADALRDVPRRSRVSRAPRLERL